MFIFVCVSSTGTWFCEISFFTLCIHCADTLIRCINHLVLDSADSSEVPGTIQMHLFICNFSYYLINLRTRFWNLYFFPYLSRFPPWHIFKILLYLVFLYGILRNGWILGKRKLYDNNFLSVLWTIIFPYELPILFYLASQSITDSSISYMFCVCVWHSVLVFEGYYHLFQKYHVLIQKWVCTLGIWGLLL